MRNILVGVSLASLISLSGCSDEFWEGVYNENYATYRGEVLKESFIEGEEVVGLFGKEKKRDLQGDELTMIVRIDDGRIFSYTFLGKDARMMDVAYDVGSIVQELPTVSHPYGDEKFSRRVKVTHLE